MFSCNCFLQKTGSSGCVNSNLDFTLGTGDKVYSSIAYVKKGSIVHNGYAYIYSGITQAERPRNVENLSIEKYMEWYISQLHSNGTAFDNMYGGYTHYIELMIRAMNNTDPYSGDLYYWEPSGGSGFQRLIGIGGCGPGDQVSDCPTDLATLLSDRKYDTEDERKNSSSYMTELQKLKDDYPSRLNIDDPYNPRCENGGGGPNGPICDPQYNEYACSFSIDNGGFYIADTGSDTETSCWLGAGIAYNYGTDEVSSDTNLGNKYCAVRCWEAFGADFPGAIDNIKAGTFFFWGRGSSSDGYLGNLNATRYCQTVGIDYDTFKSDYYANEKAVLQAYNKYKAQEKFNDQTPAKGAACTLTDDTKCTANKLEGGSQTTYANCIAIGGLACYNCDSSGVEGGGGWCLASGATRTYCTSCSSGWTPSGGTCTKAGTTYSKTQESHTSSNGYLGSDTQYSSDDASTCIANDTGDDTAKQTAANAALNTDLSTLKTDLQNAITAREGITKLIRSCQSQEFINKDNTDLYTFKGEVKLKYTDPAGINRNIDGAVLNRVDDVSVQSLPGAVKQVENLICTSTPGITGITDLSGCYADSLTPSEDFALTNYANYSWKYTGLFKYYYPANEYSWKAIVENAHVVNEKTYTAD